MLSPDCRGSGADFIHDQGFLPTDPLSSMYVQRSNRKNTVKELLMIRRQKWSCSQDDNKNAEQHVNDLLAHATPVDAINVDQRPPDNSHVAPQQMCPTLQGQVSLTAQDKMTLFHWQIQREQWRLGGVSPEMLQRQDGDGDTFLHIAVAQGRRALACVLATKMAQYGFLDLKEHNGQTALQIAAATNHHLIVQDLLIHRAKINTQDLWGRTPLHVCAEKGHYSTLQTIWRVLKGSAQQIDVEMFNYDGLTPLHTAVKSHNAVAKELRVLENPCSYRKKELAQKSRTYIKCIKTLLLMGASIGTKELKGGRTCLHIASEEANVELLNILCDHSQSHSAINAMTFNGNTALHVACALQNHKNQAEVVKLLMRRGADPGIRNLESELPSQLVPEGPKGKKVHQALKGKHVHAQLNIRHTVS